MRRQIRSIILSLCSCLIDDQEKEMLMKTTVSTLGDQDNEATKDASIDPAVTTTDGNRSTLTIEPRVNSTVWLDEWCRRRHSSSFASREVMYLTLAPLSPKANKEQFLNAGTPLSRKHGSKNSNSNSSSGNGKGHNELLVVPKELTKHMCQHELALGHWIQSPPRTPRSSGNSINRGTRHNHHSVASSSYNVHSSSTTSTSCSCSLCSCSDLSNSTLHSEVISERSAVKGQSTSRLQHNSNVKRRGIDDGSSMDTAFALHS